MSRVGRRRVGGGLAVLAILATLAGCAQTVGGEAMKAGSGSTSRNDKSAKEYPNLLKECDVLTSDVIAKTVGADPLDIQSTFVGAVCRWQAPSASTAASARAGFIVQPLSTVWCLDADAGVG